MNTTAYIGVGANLGDRHAMITRALAMLAALPNSQLLATAPLLRTAPVDCPPNSADFLNTVVALETALDPGMLLNALLDIERSLGRVRTAARNEPRVIDLDLLLYGDRIINDEGIVVPHPRMHMRDFVLAPLADIAPDAIHPVLGKNAATLLAELEDTAPVASS